MPIAEVELPDGRVAEVEIPEGMTEQQAQAQIQSMFEQGAFTAAQPLEQQEEQRERLIQEEMQRLAAEQGPLEAVAIGAGRGLTAIGRGLGLVEPPTATEQAAIEALREERPITTMTGEVLGQAAPFLVPGMGAAGITGAKARAAAVAGLGALEAGLAARGEQRGLEEQFTAAGVGGAVAGAADILLPRIARAGGQIIRRVLRKAPEGAVIDRAGRPSAEFKRALDELGMTIDDVAAQERAALAGQVIDPEQAARREFLEAQGLKPTRAQITRTAADFAEQQEAAKTSGLVREQLMEQNAYLTSRFDNTVLESAGAAERGGASVFDAITDKASDLDQRIADLYSEARARARTPESVDPTAIVSAVRAAKGDDKATKGAISSIAGDLRNKGIIDAKGKILKNISIDEAENIRIGMNRLYDAQEPFRNIKLRDLKDAVDESVFKSAGEDVFEQARAAKRAFEGELNTAKLSKFDARGKNVVRDILENKIAPDELTDKMVFSKVTRPEDLNKLKSYLSTTEAGKQAFDDMRAEALTKIKEATFRGPLDENNLANMSRAGLQSTLSKIGKKKMDVLFNKEEQKFLNNMLQVAKLREPTPGQALGRGPSAAAIARATNEIKRMLRTNPKFSALVESVTFDSKGRAVLKANPEKIIQGPTLSERQITGAAAQVAAAAAAAPQEQ